MLSVQLVECLEHHMGRLTDGVVEACLAAKHVEWRGALAGLVALENTV